MTTVARRQLASFRTEGYDKGRPVVVQALWLMTGSTVFRWWWTPARVRVALLRLFGAHVGSGVLVRHGVRVLWPWKLTIGDGTWIGEGVWLLNLEPVSLGADVCISQEAMLCTGSHDYRRPDFAFRNAPVVVRDGAWVAARAVVLAGVTVGTNAVVAAGTVVSCDVADDTLVGPAGSRPIAA